MNCAERVAEHVNGETAVAAGRSSGADPAWEALRFPSNTILAVTDGQALYAFHPDPHDGLIGRWPLGEVGAKLDACASNLNYLEIVGMWELLLSFADGRSIPTSPIGTRTTWTPGTNGSCWSRLAHKVQKRCAPPRLPIEFTSPYQAVWYRKSL